MTHFLQKITLFSIGIFSLSGNAQVEKTPDSLGRFTLKVKTPLIYNESKAWHPTLGLANRHIALWPSHGRYYNQKEDRWIWQRARIFQTVEDIYTQSYVLPFLVPMLENAGATVLMPRERDINPHELIIDNDQSSTGCTYAETNKKEKWNDGDKAGFAQKRIIYKDFENPFKEGTFRQIKTVKKEPSEAVWTPDIPEEGEYGVYVSYQSLPESADDAQYTIYHKGQKTIIKVNQTMGGGTWIFLGSYRFDKGKNDQNKVVLSNLSNKKGRIITADAVKIGGGEGNIARAVKGDSITYPYHTSGYPKYKEGARYWMQWAGVPDSIYSPTQGEDDYRDDYLGRGYWVNWLAGGSEVCPDRKGLNIPIDLSFAFHSDAGSWKKDTIVGTLIICDYEKKYYDGKYSNGASRELAKWLCQDIQDQICDDLSRSFEPKWTKRGLWNRPYSESLWPMVPAALLELLSHHNFTDMRYGLDPRFRFAASRAIYKGMVKFICSQYGIKYCIQPLAPDHLNLKFEQDGQVTLSWNAVSDSLEPTAEAEHFVVYRRVGNGNFDNGTLVKKGTQFTCAIPVDEVCSFKVTAVNKGGESFPSEILSVGKSSQGKETVLVVSGFDRICGPADFKAAPPADVTLAGFLDDIDHGVPYIRETNYTGSQKEFRRDVYWTTDDSPGFGGSRGNHEKETIAGNTFDYPFLHGTAIMNAGYSFISTSNECVEDNLARLTDYKIVDWILGKQRQTKTGRGGIKPLQFKTLTASAQDQIKNFCQAGGRFFLSGAYVASDFWDNPDADPDTIGQRFAKEVLKYKFREVCAAKEGVVKAVPSKQMRDQNEYHYYHQLNPESYVVESPDGIVPEGEGAFTTFRYAENEIGAGVAYKGTDYSTYILAFPFESIKCPKERDRIMQGALDFLSR
ncbi:MAG: xanthan lyase [Bacteroidaceae bacterium]|nr:xanthan lyase [Bacteroidaceae bacterium]